MTSPFSRPSQVRPAPPRQSKSFDANFDGECAACGDSIDAGFDIVLYEDDELIHVECAE